MKKILIFTSLFVAAASFGGTALLAHAQTATMTPDQQAALEQQLQVAKAELIQLQTQAGQVPAGDNMLPSQPAVTAPTLSMTESPTATLSATDVSNINATLSALVGVLSSLETKLAQDPQFAVTNGPAVVSQLQGIGSSLAGIVNQMTAGNIAMANPSTATQGAGSGAGSTGSASAGSGNAVAGGGTTSGAQGIAQTTPSAGTGAAAGSNPSAQGLAPSVDNTSPAAAAPVTPQTAQASSAFSFGKLNWPLIIVIVLIIAAIAIWLWWDDGDEKKPVVKNISSAPRPGQTVTTMSSQVNSNNPSTGSSYSSSSTVQTSSPATPLSSAMGSDPKRKPA